LTRLMVFCPLTVTISANKAFVRDGVRRLKWLLPPFVRTRRPDPVTRNRFEVALWVLSLYLGVLTFAVTANSSQQNVRLLAQSHIIPEELNFD
jgi:hypothetical protein